MAQKQLESMPTSNKQPLENKKRKNIQPSSRSSKKLRMDGNLIDAARRIARYSDVDLDLINRSRGLSDVPVGTVLEMLSAEQKTSVHGDMTLFTCFMDDRRKNPVKIMAPARMYDEDHAFPAVYAYFGKRETKTRTGSAVTAHRLVRLMDRLDSDAVTERARDLRKLPLDKLEAAMGTTRSFRDLRRGSVVVLDGFRVVSVDGGAETIVATHTGVVCGDDECVETGEIYVPARFKDELKSCGGRAVAVYKGLTTTRDGHECFDITLISEDNVDRY